MWLRPNALQTEKMRFHSPISVGGYPVLGKIAHSRVPRRKTGLSLTENRVPSALKSRMPKTCPGHRFQGDEHGIQVGGEFVPKQGVVSHGVDHLHGLGAGDHDFLNDMLQPLG